MRIISSAVLATFALALGLAAPVAAQEDEAAGDYRVNQLIIYGDDECPVSTAAEITVCARKEESERYRIPEDLRGSEGPQNEAWTQRVLAYETVGKDGINSCSPVGMGGEFGCTTKLIQKAYAEKDGAASARFGELIQKEREKRLSTIDTDAAEQQKRVEEAEAQYDARKRAEEEAAAFIADDVTRSGGGRGVAARGVVAVAPARGEADDQGGYCEHAREQPERTEGGGHWVSSRVTPAAVPAGR